MKILAGVIPDFEGELLMRGKPVRFRGTRDAERAGMSIIHQELNLVEQLSAAANIFLGRETRTATRPARQSRDAPRGRRAVRPIGVPRPARTSRSATLRVGDQQLVEIAKALSLREPKS